MTLEFKHDPRGETVRGKLYTFIEFFVFILILFGMFALAVYLSQ